MLILLALAAHADDPADRPYNPIGKRDPFRSFLGPICTGGGCVPVSYTHLTLPTTMLV